MNYLEQELAEGGTRIPSTQCPVCFEPTDELYIDDNGECIGCPECIRKVDAEDFLNQSEDY